MIYLDGNSLGVLPKAAPARVARAVQRGMGPGPDPHLEHAPAGSSCRSAWATRSPGWSAPAPGEVVATDSTSVNLFKVLSAALRHRRAPTRPQRRVIVSERSNFPTDLYIAEGAVRASAAASCVLVDAGRDRRRAGRATPPC